MVLKKPRIAVLIPVLRGLIKWVVSAAVSDYSYNCT